MEQRSSIKIYLYFIATLITLCLLYIVGWLLPYEPFTFYGWKSSPSVACPLQPIRNTIETELESGPYTVGRLEGDTFWINEEGQTYGEAPINVDLEPYKKRVEDSYVSRTAPPIPGRWYIRFDGYLTGRMWGIVSTRQEVFETSKEPVIVEPLTKKDCIIITERGEE